MALPTSDNDAELRRVLDEVSMGRLTVDEAVAEVKRLQSQTPSRTTSMGRRRAGAEALWIVGLVFTLFGALFGGVGGFMAWKSFQFQHDTARADATVIEMVRNGDTWKPVVEYMVAGKKYELVASVGSSPPRYDIGEKVSVLYRPNNPAEAQIDTLSERWILPIIFGGIGGVFFLIGVVMLLVKTARKLTAFSPTAAPERFTVE